MRVVFVSSLVSSVLAGQPHSLAQKKQVPSTQGNHVSEASSSAQNVIDQLNELKAEFQAGFNDEEKRFNKYSQEQEVIIKEQTQDRDDAAARITVLDEDIRKNSGSIGSLEGVVAGLKKDISDLAKEMEEAASRREKEKAESESQRLDRTEEIKTAQIAWEILSDQSSKLRTSTDRSYKFLSTSNSKDQTAVFASLKKSLSSLPAKNSLSFEDLDTLTKFLDDHLDVKKQTSLLQSTANFDSVIGILKTMRVDAVTDLQALQTEEQRAKLSYKKWFDRKTAFNAQLEIDLKSRSAQLTSEEAQKQANVAERERKREEQKKAAAMVIETTEALKQASKDFAKESERHTTEMMGIDKALDYLTKTTTVGSSLEVTVGSGNTADVAMLQLAETKTKKPLYEVMFQKIVWAIEDMRKEHKKEISDNSDKQVSCSTAVTASEEASKALNAKREHFDRQVTNTIASIEQTTNEKSNIESKIADNEESIKNGQANWDTLLAARQDETAKLKEMVPLIKGAIHAIAVESGAGGEEGRLKDVIAVLKNLMQSTKDSIKTLTDTQTEEGETWAAQRRGLEEEIDGWEKDVLALENSLIDLNRAKAEFETKLDRAHGESVDPEENCKMFLLQFQEAQNKIHTKVQNLNSAQKFIENWTDQSVDAQHAEDTTAVA